MSEKKIVIVQVPGMNFYCSGGSTRNEAVAEFRRHWDDQIKEAERFLAITPEDLTVFSCYGPCVQKNRKEMPAQPAPSEGRG